MQVGNLLHKWNVENDQACNKLPTSFKLVRLVGCNLNRVKLTGYNKNTPMILVETNLSAKRHLDRNSAV